MMKNFGKAIASVLVLSFLVAALPGKSLAAPAATPQAAPKAEAVKPDASSPDAAIPDKVEAQNAAIIRGVLIGASAVWNSPWFQRMVISLVRAFSNTRAANAIRDSWVALGRTVDNLIGTQRLSWTVVQDAVYRTVRDQGFRDVARQAAVALQEAFKSLIRFFK